jgi:hypothetical protein
VGIGGICYPQGVRIEPPVATQFPLYILGSNITCGQLVAPNNINDYPALGILSSNDSFNRLVFGLTNGTPFFGLGPGSGNRDIFVRRQSASTLRIAGNSAGSSSGNLEVTGQIQATGTTASTSTTTGALTVAGGAGIAGALHVGGQINGLGAVQSGTPASAAATGTAGQIRWDADYIYVCTATNTWKRVAISTW